MTTKPITHQRDLAKLPKALAPLIQRPKWCVWRWTQRPDGSFQKPPFMATQPGRHASTTDPTTWADYPTALATVQSGYADGISYLLTETDPFAAIDLDDCRCLITNSIDVWAQNWLDTGRHSYTEVTPSGTGCRIWGLANGDRLHRKFISDIDGKPIAVEMFRRTNKALTITGYTLDPAIRELTCIDKVLSWGLTWGERRKAQAAPARVNGNGFDSSGCAYTLDQIEQIVRTGAPEGTNRSNLFHSIVGHYVGCGWKPDQILGLMQQFPDGLGGRYLAEGRLGEEIARSAGKYRKPELPGNSTWVNGWGAKSPEPKPDQEEPHEEPESDPDDDDPELDDDSDEHHDPNLPRLYAHGDPDPRPLKSWLIKNLMPAVGHGLLSGQWGAGKTFVLFDLAAALGTGQPFLGHTVKRQCGVLLIASEGADEVRLRLDAVVRAKFGGLERAPFRWYETAPPLLHKDAVRTLVAMAKQAEASLLKEFGLPLGLIAIDTIAASAGYSRSGDENDNAVGQAIMNVFKAVAQELKCFVMGIDHFGKDQLAGTRGAGSKESSGDVVLACLGDKQLSGSMTDTRLVVRKHRGGRQGQEYPFTLREVVSPEPDEDGDPITTMVVDWQPPGAAGPAAQPRHDPWAASRREDQRIAVLRLRRVMMAILAEHGVDQLIPPEGSVVRMIDQELVREGFYASTPADGTAAQKGELRRKRFNRALDWAENQRLLAVREIKGTTYLWLTNPDPEPEEAD